MTPGEEIDNQLDALETKIELLMAYLGLEFDFDDSWSDEPTGIREVRPVIANWSNSTMLGKEEECES